MCITLEHVKGRCYLIVNSVKVNIFVASFSVLKGRIHLHFRIICGCMYWFVKIILFFVSLDFVSYSCTFDSLFISGRCLYVLSWLKYFLKVGAFLGSPYNSREVNNNCSLHFLWDDMRGWFAWEAHLDCV